MYPEVDFVHFEQFTEISVLLQGHQKLALAASHFTVSTSPLHLVSAWEVA
jgi:hypothetical protein